MFVVLVITSCYQNGKNVHNLGKWVQTLCLKHNCMLYPVLKQYKPVLKAVNQKVHFWSFQHSFGVQVTLLELNMTEKDFTQRSVICLHFFRSYFSKVPIHVVCKFSLKYVSVLDLLCKAHLWSSTGHLFEVALLQIELNIIGIT